MPLDELVQCGWISGRRQNPVTMIQRPVCQRAAHASRASGD
jgi:hypothetical protein